MLNFDYLKDDVMLEPLHRYCDMAEQRMQTEPEVSALNARRALEWIVKSVYEMKEERVGERTSLFELTDSMAFRDFINDPDVMKAVHWVRKVGNQAAHDGNVTKGEAFYSLVNIYNVVKAIMLKLRRFDSIPDFDRSLIPSRPRRPRISGSSAAIRSRDAADAKQFASAVDAKAIEAAPAVIPKLSWDEIDEAETRRILIDLMIREAGWDILTINGAKHPAKACVEVEVNGMPNNEGKGYADYVLFGDDGKPLAVIEDKSSSVDPHVGEQQARLYADCLEAEYGIRPAIYFTNGYETWLIDGIGYPKRRVYAFHTKEDLIWMHQQRKRKDIADMSVKEHISNRPYQKMAIKRLCEHFNAKHRRGLLVMATGTGKTRTAISLVDVMQRAGWVKNTLFLADRTSLVHQAHRNFVKLMPDVPTAVLSDKESNPDMNARIIFSTYQTMINHIDADEKTFSVGRFDLIIIDEAHRSVFGKYGAIFNYFDSLLVGLTATPRDQVDKSTYDLLQLEGGIPNFAYELEEAVADGYLVPPVGIKRDSEVMNDGIKYDSLSDEEKVQLEKVWEYEAANADPDAPGIPRDISNSEIYKYIFNAKTIDLVLQDLMENGLRVESGEKIGKSIIFAFNSAHAELIVKRFNLLYPALGADFCRQIDYSVKYAQSLIDSFEQRDSMPQIAVSVDMLDTGIDVPDVLNLVFFKRVRSRIKFMQMIGRGTRLSSGIFGAGILHLRLLRQLQLFRDSYQRETPGSNPLAHRKAVRSPRRHRILPPDPGISERHFCKEPPRQAQDASLRTGRGSPPEPYLGEGTLGDGEALQRSRSVEIYQGYRPSEDEKRGGSACRELVRSRRVRPSARSRSGNPHPDKRRNSTSSRYMCSYRSSMRLFPPTATRPGYAASPKPSASSRQSLRYSPRQIISGR